MSTDTKKNTPTKKGCFIIAAASAAIAVVTFIIGNAILPSRATYEIAAAFGDTSGEDLLIALHQASPIVALVFAAVAVAFLLIGIKKAKK